MKKLLSILSISGIIGSASSTVISCEEESGSGSATREKQDISKGTLIAISADSSEVAYQEIRTQIGAWAKPEINADEVKADMNIGISLWKGTESIKEDKGTIDAGTDYKVKINVGDADMYFNAMEAKDYNLTINVEGAKVDLPANRDVTLTDVTVDTKSYEDVWTELETQLVTLTGVTKENIDAGVTGGTITVTMMDGDGTTAVKAGAKFVVEGNNAKVTVATSANEFFNDKSVDYKLNVIAAKL